jgi:outer membrane protein assembly factor BamB
LIATNGNARATVTLANPRHLMLISTRTGQAQPIEDPTANTAFTTVADNHGGWFVAGLFGILRLRRDGSVDHNWQAPRGTLTGCHLLRVGARLYVADSVRVAAFDARTGRRLWISASFGPRKTGLCGTTIAALSASHSRVYVGGSFTAIGSKQRRLVAALDPGTGRLLAWRAPAIAGPAPAYVSALSAYGSRLYVGGLFDSVGGRSRHDLAALDAVSGAVLPWHAAQVGDVASLLVTHHQVVSAGYDDFNATDALTGRARGWRARIFGTPSSFAVAGDVLYLGGDLRNSVLAVDGKTRHNLAAFDFGTGRFTSWAPNLARYVTVGTIAPSGTSILVLGSFTRSIA